VEDMNNVVSGKKKRDAYIIQKGMKVAKVEFNDGFSMDLKIPLKAKLIEINRQVLQGKLETINCKAESDGFLLIIDPPFS
jgi:glycine cleavage system H lipoate-binding protein